MVMDLVSAVACETARSASRIERLARTFIWVILFMGRKVCDDGLNDEARSGNRGPVQSGDRLSNPRYSISGSLPRWAATVDPHRLTQVGRALRELGIQMIPAYSPQARGRSERNFRTWQGRLPPELRARQIRTLEDANRFLREQYVQQFNQRFSKPASQRGTAFVPLRRKDLDLVFALHHERIVARDNTVSFANKTWQLERCKLRATLAGCRVTIHEHLDQTISITFRPHLVGRYNAAAGH